MPKPGWGEVSKLRAYRISEAFAKQGSSASRSSVRAGPASGVSALRQSQLFSGELNAEIPRDSSGKKLADFSFINKKDQVLGFLDR